jgi:hypothetical protein
MCYMHKNDEQPASQLVLKDELVSYLFLLLLLLLLNHEVQPRVRPGLEVLELDVGRLGPGEQCGHLFPVVSIEVPQHVPHHPQSVPLLAEVQPEHVTCLGQRHGALLHVHEHGGLEEGDGGLVERVV